VEGLQKDFDPKFPIVPVELRKAIVVTNQDAAGDSLDAKPCIRDSKKSSSTRRRLVDSVTPSDLFLIFATANGNVRTCPGGHPSGTTVKFGPWEVSIRLDK
jgi:hypothetical protein